MDQIPAGMLAAADREMADREMAQMRERIGFLVKSYKALIADGDDGTIASSRLCYQLAEEPKFTRIDLSGLLSVAVSMLAEAPDTIPGRDLLDEPAVAFDAEDPNAPKGGC